MRLNIAHNSNNFTSERRAPVLHCYVLADRIFVGPELASHGLIDDHDPAGAPVVMLGKLAPRDEGNSHSAKVAGIDGADIGGGLVIWGRKG